ncbi:MAG: hypothetical protein WCF07_00690 [Nitrososphaeraceae archaeon]
MALFVTIAVGFTNSEIIVTIAQQNGNISSNNVTALNSTESGGKNIVITWLELNGTKTDHFPLISISSEDFWKIFGPLFELSTDGSIDTLEQFEQQTD